MARGTDLTPEPLQLTLDELGPHLREVTFVVIDLETTGATARDAHITEIGAVKIRGGEVLGEFQTLINPGYPVPAFISRLTGITTAMVRDAPRVDAVIPSLIEFMHGAVLVAHNAPFDISFLKAAFAEAGYPWPGHTVIDTVPLARKVVSRDEVPNHKLSTLARFFQAQVTPDHRALADARATVDVLHALFDRLGARGITHLADLPSASDPVAPETRKKRHLADGLPEGPGVYLFKGPDGEVLYVGTSSHVRQRVRSYFTAAERRSRIIEMVRLAVRVEAVACTTTTEAQVQELRLITQFTPRYNRRSTHPERMPWVRLTAEPYPRLSIVTEVTADAVHIGPYASRQLAQASIAAIHAALPIRQCSTRLPARPSPTARACLLADFEACSAPCIRPDPDYPQLVEQIATAMTTSPQSVVNPLTQQIARYCGEQHYEQAAERTHQLRAFLAGADRAQRFAPLARCAQLVAARPAAQGSWEVVVIRYGRLAATGISPAGMHPQASIEAALATAEIVDPPIPPATAAHPHETEILLHWLESEGVRLIDVSHPLSCPVWSARDELDLHTASSSILAHLGHEGVGL